MHARSSQAKVSRLKAQCGRASQATGEAPTGQTGLEAGGCRLKALASVPGVASWSPPGLLECDNLFVNTTELSLASVRMPGILSTVGVQPEISKTDRAPLLHTHCVEIEIENVRTPLQLYECVARRGRT